MEILVSKAGNQVKLCGVSAHWPHLHTPRPKYKKPDILEYSVDVLISEEIMDKLSDLSVNKSPKTIKEKNRVHKKSGKAPVYVEYPEDLYILKLTAPAFWRDGSARPIPVLYNKQPHYDLVGNGSIVDVVIRLGSPNADRLRAAYLEKVIIQTLVEYEGKDEFTEEGEEAFLKGNKGGEEAFLKGNKEGDFDDDELAF